jgi:hypothetical protein
MNLVQETNFVTVPGSGDHLGGSVMPLAVAQGLHAMI